MTRPDAILASNTSSIPLVKLAVATSRPDHVIGIHFFNPVPVQKLVELIPALTTCEDTVTRAQAFARRCWARRHPRPGPFGLRGQRAAGPLPALRDPDGRVGIGTREDIDSGMELGCAHPMGPLRLSDLIGLDTIAVADSMYEEYKEPLYAAPPLLQRMVDAGRLGRKTGSGFYPYD